MDDRTCACGHEYDEHDSFGSKDCMIDGCGCVAYEPMEPDDDPERRALGADSLLPPERAKRRPPICEGCGKNRSDPPSPLCPGCQAYQEHQQ